MRYLGLGCALFIGAGAIAIVVAIVVGFILVPLAAGIFAVMF